MGEGRALQRMMSLALLAGGFPTLSRRWLLAALA